MPYHLVRNVLAGPPRAYTSPEALVLLGIDGVVLAGGAARALYYQRRGQSAPTPGDLDFFLLSKADGREVERTLGDIGYTLQRTAPTGARLFARDTVDGSPDIEVVPPSPQHPRGDVHDIFDRFSFHVEQFAYRIVAGVLVEYATEEGLADFEAKRLRVYHIANPVNVVRRMNKYGLKGFTIGMDEVDKVMRNYAARTPGWRADMTESIPAFIAAGVPSGEGVRGGYAG